MNGMYKKLFFSYHCLLSIFTFAFIFSSVYSNTSAIAVGTDSPLSGYSWGADSVGGDVGGMGWADFSGVTQLADGTLSGYAWSSNYGWLQFGGLSGFPRGSGTTPANAKVNTNGTLSGWAKFVNGGTTPGWHGWVSLSGAGYGVTKTGDQFGGYAWGGGASNGEGSGWMSFYPSAATAIPPAGCTSGCGGVIGGSSAFDFSITAPASFTVVRKTNDVLATATAQIGIVGSNTTPVSLTVTGLPSGVSVTKITFVPCSSACSPVITFSVSPSADLGPHPLTLIASASGVASKTATFNLTIESFDYNLTRNKDTLTLIRGGATNTFTITNNLISGTPQPVTAARVTALPPGIAVTASNLTCTPSNSCTSSFVFKALSTAGLTPVGEPLLFTFKSSSSGLADKSIDVSVVVKDPSCTGPNGEDIFVGQSVTYYEKSVVAAGKTCVSETLTCTAPIPSLIPTPSQGYTKTSCTVEPSIIEI